MWNMNDVRRIKYQKGYIYSIEFDDGMKGDIDFLGLVLTMLIRLAHTRSLLQRRTVEGPYSVGWGEA
jgi:hypothetical protein